MKIHQILRLGNPKHSEEANACAFEFEIPNKFQECTSEYTRLEDILPNMETQHQKLKDTVKQINALN